MVRRWEELKAQYTQQIEGPGKHVAAPLLAFLGHIFAPSVLSLAQFKQTGKISFPNVWQIFPPSSVVKTRFFGVDTVCRVVKYKRVERSDGRLIGWAIDMEYVDWNGETSGWTTTTLTIWEYESHRKVAGLPVFPIELSSEADFIKARFTERGRRWAELRGYHFEVANGTKIQLKTGELQQRPVSINPLSV